MSDQLSLSTAYLQTPCILTLLLLIILLAIFFNVGFLYVFFSLNNICSLMCP